MNKSIFILLIIIVAIPLVSALDKPIHSIPYCYNATVHARLLSGNYTDIWFKDCSKLDKYNFSCDCKDRGTFNLTLQNDGTNLDYQYWRNYQFDITYYQYILNVSKGRIFVTDSGGGWNIRAKDMDTEAISPLIISQPIYINQTVEKIVYVNVTKEVPKETKVYINNCSDNLGCSGSCVPKEEGKILTVYVENTTKIDELEKIIALKDNAQIMVLIIGLVMGIGMSIGYIFLRNLYKKDDKPIGGTK